MYSSFAPSEQRVCSGKLDKLVDQGKASKAPKIHGYQNEYCKPHDKAPAWAVYIKNFKDDARRGLKKIGVPEKQSKTIVTFISAFAHAVFAKQGDYVMSAKKLAQMSGCGRTTVNAVLAELKAAGAHEVVGCHGGGRIKGRGIAAERWVYLPAILDWLKSRFGKLPKALETAFNSLNEKLFKRFISEAQQNHKNITNEEKSKCSVPNTTKCIERGDATDLDSQRIDAPEPQPEPEMEHPNPDCPTSDETPSRDETLPGPENEITQSLEGASAPAAPNAQPDAAKPTLCGNTITQDTTKVEPLSAANNDRTPAVGNLSMMIEYHCFKTPTAPRKKVRVGFHYPKPPSEGWKLHSPSISARETRSDSLRTKPANHPTWPVWPRNEGANRDVFPKQCPQPACRAC